MRAQAELFDNGRIDARFVADTLESRVETAARKLCHSIFHESETSGGEGGDIVRRHRDCQSCACGAPGPIGQAMRMVLTDCVAWDVGVLKRIWCCAECRFVEVQSQDEDKNCVEIEFARGSLAAGSPGFACEDTATSG